MLSWVGRVLALAGINYIAGKLALQLAIPPGYASALWPPAGIALAAVLVCGYQVLPGVMLGSFLLNVHVGATHDKGSVLLAIGISAASTLQAAVGAALIRKFVVFPNPFVRQRDIILFFALGGPLVCLCASTISVMLLWICGRISGSSVFYSWWTWWVGDFIGVLIFSPLFFVAFAHPRDVWMRRNLTVALPLIVAVLGVTILFVFARTRERQRQQLEFEDNCVRLANDVTDQLRGYEEVMWSVARFFDSSHDVTREEFRRFTEPTIQRLRGLEALSWNPRVLRPERASFEAEVRATDISFYRIVESDGQGNLVPVRPRAEYVPVLYIVPLEQNINALGFDVASEPARLETLKRAAKSNNMVVSGAIHLVQDSARRIAVAMFVPVFERDSTRQPPAAARDPLRGYAAGVFHVDDVVDEALGPFPSLQGIQLRVIDATTPGHEQDLYSGKWRLTENKVQPHFQCEIKHVFGGRKWIMQFYSTPEYVATLVRWQSWAVDAVGLALAALLGILLLIVDGRAVDVRIANTKLRDAVQARDEFLSVASHELRTPLTPLKLQLQSLDRLLTKSNGDPTNTERLLKRIRSIDNQVDRLIRLVDELLDTSRITVGRLVLEKQLVEVCRLVEEVLERHAREFRAASTAVSIHAPTPIVGYFDRLRLDQVITNLVTNALKYASGKPVQITIEANGPQMLLVVEDQGSGISPADLERIFERFEQVIGPGQQRGLGLGLFIVKQIVEAHGGTIRAESRLGHGSRFIVEMPLGIMGEKD